MPKITKKQKEIQKIADVEKVYPIQEAVLILKKLPHAKFDETVELAFNLGTDPKQSDQMVRGT
ncbi:MAG: 50S ribosomal protein L1, partial [bacterium]|nr:50S ribosomal protein L1 [bacterium]